MGTSLIGPPQATIPAFKGDLKIASWVNTMANDYKPPNFGHLNVANLGTPTALNGAPPGVDTKVITGSYTAKISEDSITEIDKNCLSLVHEDQKHEVMGDQIEKIHKKTELTYLHGRDVTVGDEDLLSVNGHQEIFVLGESEATYRAKHEVHVPFEFEMKATEQGLTVAELKFVGGAAVVRGREAVYKIRDLECPINQGPSARDVGHALR